MIRKLFQDSGIKVTNAEFKEIMKITTDDIRENRMKFGKKTSMEQMFTIAKRSLKVLMSAYRREGGNLIYCRVGKCPMDLKEALCCIYCTKHENCPNACKSTNEACRLSFEVKKEPFDKGPN